MTQGVKKRPSVETIHSSASAEDDICEGIGAEEEGEEEDRTEYQ